MIFSVIKIIALIFCLLFDDWVWQLQDFITTGFFITILTALTFELFLDSSSASQSPSLLILSILKLSAFYCLCLLVVILYLTIDFALLSSLLDLPAAFKD